MNQISELSFLFFSAFLSATIFPAGSEMVLVGLNTLGKYQKILLLVIATLGNVLGSVVNWLLGSYFMKFQNKRWFKVKQSSLSKPMAFYKKWGVWTLLFSWLPIIGDPLTIIAGMFKTNIFTFLILVTIGKAARYMAILAVL
jgi:membrane protein YqaA with SNARE-associated domain